MWINGESRQKLAYCANLTGEDGAHATAKRLPSIQWEETFVDELEIQTDKAAIVALLNGHGPSGELVPKRSWCLTARGGLHEIAADA
jgi:hypothetical protein